MPLFLTFYYLVFTTLSFIALVAINKIFFNFLYFYFDIRIYNGDLYFWQHEFLLTAISLIIIFVDYKNRNLSKEENIIKPLIKIGCVLFLLMFFGQMFLCTTWRYYFFSQLLNIILIPSYLIIFFTKKFKCIIMTFLLIDIIGFFICNKIFLAKDIPESFKYDKVDADVRKFIIKSKLIN